MTKSEEQHNGRESGQAEGAWGRFVAAWRRWRERWWFRWSVDLLMILALVLGISLWQSRHLRGSGEQIPQFSLAQLEGGAGEPLWEKDGKKTLLYMWAPWCGVCSAASGTVSTVQNWVGDGVEVKSVVLDFQSRGAVEDYVRENGVDYPVLLGDDRVYRTFNVRSFPTFYVLSDDGKVEATSVGYTTTLGLLVRSWW